MFSSTCLINSEIEALHDSCVLISTINELWRVGYDSESQLEPLWKTLCKENLPNIGAKKADSKKESKTTPSTFSFFAMTDFSTPAVIPQQLVKGPVEKKDQKAPQILRWADMEGELDYEREITFKDAKHDPKEFQSSSPPPRSFAYATVHGAERKSPSSPDPLSGYTRLAGPKRRNA